MMPIKVSVMILDLG